MAGWAKADVTSGKRWWEKAWQATLVQSRYQLSSRTCTGSRLNEAPDLGVLAKALASLLPHALLLVQLGKPPRLQLTYLPGSHRRALGPSFASFGPAGHEGERTFWVPLGPLQRDNDTGFSPCPSQAPPECLPRSQIANRLLIQWHWG